MGLNMRSRRTAPRSFEEGTSANSDVLGGRASGRICPDLPVIGERMRGVLTLLSQYAQLDELVLLRGPTGVGKTHLAEWVHAHSSRCHGPFVVADLLGVPETGPEVALFGVVDRFFSGVRGRAGWVELAAGGTLFIDEIDKLNLALQSKLLRLLDRREYTVVGDGRTQRADLRLIVGASARTCTSASRA